MFQNRSACSNDFFYPLASRHFIALNKVEPLAGSEALLDHGYVMFQAVLFTLTLLLGSYGRAGAEVKIFEKTKEAQKLLEGVSLKYEKKKAVKRKGERSAAPERFERDIAVAGLSLRSGAIKLYTFRETIPLGPKANHGLKPPVVIAQDKECRIVWRGGNRFGFLRDLALFCGQDQYVVIGMAMPRLISVSTVTPASDKKLSCNKKEIVRVGYYVPYSPELHQGELVKIGRAYVENVILKAFEELSEARVSSRAVSDLSLSELASVDFIHALIIDEHMDHEEFGVASRNGGLARLIEKFWVEAALNQENAKAWSISSAGACCLTQFICATYARILREYPDAGLNSVFFEGMRDHLNAIKATVVLLDSDSSRWWNDKTRSFCNSSVDTLEECWAASYNGGPGRLNRVIAARGALWQTSEPLIKKKRKYFAPRLREETRVYLAKLKAVREYLLESSNE